MRMKSALLALLLNGFLNPGAGAVESKSYGYVPGVPMRLGEGFNERDPKRDYLPCFKDLVTAPGEGGAQNTDVKVLLVSGTETVKRFLKVDHSVDASFLIFKGNTSLDISSDFQLDSQDVNILVTGASNFGTVSLNLDRSSYLPDVQKLIDAGQYARFRERCGPAMVSTIERGSSVSIVISIRGVSSTDKTTLDFKMGGGVAFKALSASGKMNLNAILSGANTKYNASLNAVVQGGAGLPSLSGLVGAVLSGPDGTGRTSLKALSDGVTDVLKALTRDQATVTGFYTVPFPGVYDNEQNLMAEARVEELRRIVKRYRSQLRPFEDARELFDVELNSGRPAEELQNIHPHVVEQAKADMPAYAEFLTGIARAHQACLQGKGRVDQECRLPQRPALIGFDHFYNILTLIIRD